MGTFGIFKTIESGAKNHSNNLRMDNSGGLMFTTNTGGPLMAFEPNEIGSTELEDIPGRVR